MQHRVVALEVGLNQVELLVTVPEATDLLLSLQDGVLGLVVDEVGPKLLLESSVRERVITDSLDLVGLVRGVPSKGFLSQGLLLSRCEIAGSAVGLGNGIAMLRGQSSLEDGAVDGDVTCLNPGGCKAEIGFIIEEGKSLIDAEALQRLVLLLLECLLERKVSNRLAERVCGIDWDVGVDSKSKRCVGRVDQILVLLIDHLVEDFGEPGGRVEELPHHDDELANDNHTVQLSWNLSEMVLEEFSRLVAYSKRSETVVITVQQDGLWDLEPHKLRHICDFLRLQVHLLNHFVDSLSVEVADVEALLPVYLVTKLSEALP